MNDSIFFQSLDTDRFSEAIRLTEEISHNTNDWYGASNILMSVVTILGVIFGFIALFPLFQIWLDQRRDKAFQTAVMDDLIRHFFVNEIILVALKECSDANNHAIDFMKLPVLPEDLNLNRFTTKSETYSALHEIELKMRNYGLHSEWVAQHLSELSHDQFIKECDALIDRGKKITEALDKHKETHLQGWRQPYQNLNEVIKNSYAKDYLTDDEKLLPASQELTDLIRKRRQEKKMKEWA